jgi:hypothetical protein
MSGERARRLRVYYVPGHSSYCLDQRVFEPRRLSWCNRPSHGSLEDEWMYKRGEGNCRDDAKDPDHTEESIVLVVARHGIATCSQGFLDVKAGCCRRN